MRGKLLITKSFLTYVAKVTNLKKRTELINIAFKNSIIS